MSRSSSAGVVRRALNRVLPAPPTLSRRAAALVKWTGPVASDDDIPPPIEAFTRLIPRHDARPAEYLISQLARPDVGKDGHIQRSLRT
jgi:hypothetical protein